MILKRLNLYSFTLSNSIPRIAPKEDCELLFLNEQKPELLTVCPEALIESRFSRDEICCCALHRSEIVSCCWIAFDWEFVGEIERLVELKEGELYLFDAFTSSAHRGRDLFPAILSKTLEWAESQGYSRALIFALSENRASVRAVTKAGFQLFQTVTSIRFFGRSLCWPGRRKAGQEEVQFERGFAPLL